MTKVSERQSSLGFIKKLNRTWLASIIVIVFFLISVSGFIFPDLKVWSAKVSNREYNGEGLIETIEAICWFAASFIYFLLLVKDVKKNGWRLGGFWLLFFGIFCFVSFGEEVSWGQHLLSFEPSEFIQEINKQKELNFHNLNISKIVGLKSDDPKYGLFQNFTDILNPLFYLVCGVFWFVIPLMKKIGFFTNNKIISALPSPVFGTVIFCGINLVAYLIIDKLLFDSGEILELSLSLVGLMVPLDVLFSKNSKIDNSFEPN